MSYIDDLKTVFGDTLPEPHIFFATMANTVIPSYQVLRKTLGFTTAHENIKLYKMLKKEFGEGPVVPPLAFSTNLPATKSAKDGDDVTFIILPTGGKTPYTYKWYWDDVLIDAEVNPSAATASLVNHAVTVDSAGTYKVVVTDAASKSITSVGCVLNVSA